MQLHFEALSASAQRAHGVAPGMSGTSSCAWTASPHQTLDHGTLAPLRASTACTWRRTQHVQDVLLRLGGLVVAGRPVVARAAAVLRNVDALRVEQAAQPALHPVHHPVAQYMSAGAVDKECGRAPAELQSDISKHRRCGVSGSAADVPSRFSAAVPCALLERNIQVVDL